MFPRYTTNINENFRLLKRFRNKIISETPYVIVLLQEFARMQTDKNT